MFKRVLASALCFGLLASSAMANPGWLKEDLNFRYGPGTRYGVIAALPGCTQIHVYEYVGGWYRAKWNGITGYVSARYVSGSDNHCYAPPPPKHRHHYYEKRHHRGASITLYFD